MLIAQSSSRAIRIVFVHIHYMQPAAAHIVLYTCIYVVARRGSISIKVKAVSSELSDSEIGQQLKNKSLSEVTMKKEKRTKCYSNISLFLY